MTTSIISTSENQTPGEIYRKNLALRHENRLKKFAWRGIHHFGKKNDEFVVICIQANDITYTTLLIG